MAGDGLGQGEEQGQESQASDKTLCYSFCITLFSASQMNVNVFALASTNMFREHTKSQQYFSLIHCLALCDFSDPQSAKVHGKFQQ
jgi:hypothetical protein